MKTYLTYDDVNIIPKYSELKSRDKVDLTTRFTKNTILTIPIVASPMDTITELDMAKEMLDWGGVGVIHRFQSIKKQTYMMRSLHYEWGRYFEPMPGITDGTERTINSIEYINSSNTVYNFEVDNTHNYFAGGYLVHNKCFRANVKVLLEDKSLKNIQDIEVGEKLVGKDGEINEVTELHRPKLGDEDYRAPHKQRMVSINGSGFDVSEDHMIMTTDGWKTPNSEICKLLHEGYN